MVLTANDTVISIHEAEKYKHQDDNNQIDLVIRRSFDQGELTCSYRTVFAAAIAVAYYYASVLQR